ncbi:hypothetical protein GS444_10720 [Rhodococcus hoagii]|nr:hypothetical protein [Prescottella equi]
MSEEDAVFELDDPMVGELADSCRTPLCRTERTPASHLAARNCSQAALNWLNLLVWDGGEWAPRAQIEAAAEFGDVEMTVLSDGEAVKLRHIPTGEIALGADAHEAWIALKRKVMEVAGDA